MLDRRLTDHEVRLIRRAETLVRTNHAHEGGHDHAHVLAVTDYAIRIGERVDAGADPFVVVIGALFHDLGRIGAETGVLHGLKGAAIAREWLQSTDVEADVREQILRVIARHTPTTGVPPESIEERVVYDADALDRLGIMGMLRGLIGKRGSTEYIIEDRVQKRLGDYDRLHFPVSRDMGEALHADTLTIVGLFREALKEEVRELHRMRWPVEDGLQVPVPSFAAGADVEDTPDLAAALASVEAEAEVDPRGGGIALMAPPEAGVRRRVGARSGASAAAESGCTRCLSQRETALVEEIAEFVQANHADLKAHDYAHVLSVVKNALRIAAAADEPSDPMVLVCGALLHDIGWVGSDGGAEHGLRGASIAHEYLSSTWMPADTRDRIRRVIVRHSVSSGHAPETVEERIVWDADGLAGVGLLGVARGVISGVGSMDEIIGACLRYAGKRAEDLHFDESRRIADARRADGRNLIRRFVRALKERKEQVETLRLPEERNP